MDEKASKVAKTVCIAYRLLTLIFVGGTYRYRMNDPVRVIFYCLRLLLFGILIISQTYQLIQAKRAAAEKPPLTVRSPVLLGLLCSGVPVRSVREGWYGLEVMLFVTAVIAFIDYPGLY